VFGALLADAPVGYLSEAVRLRLAEIAEAQPDRDFLAALNPEFAGFAETRLAGPIGRLSRTFVVMNAAAVVGLARDLVTAISIR